MNKGRKKTVKAAGRLILDQSPLEYNYTNFLRKHLSVHFAIENGAKISELEPYWLSLDKRVKNAYELFLQDERMVLESKMIPAFIEALYIIYKEGNKQFKLAKLDYRTEVNCSKILNCANAEIKDLFKNFQWTLKFSDKEKDLFLLDINTIEKAPRVGTTKDKMTGYREFTISNACKVFKVERGAVFTMLEKYKKFSKRPGIEFIHHTYFHKWNDKINQLKY